MATPRRSTEFCGRSANYFACGKFSHWRSECVLNSRFLEGNLDSNLLNAVDQNVSSFVNCGTDYVLNNLVDPNQNKHFEFELSILVFSGESIKVSVKGALE